MAIGLAFLGATVGAVITFWLSGEYFVHLYPHDGQDVLGAIYFGFIGGAITWAGVFALVLARPASRPSDKEANTQN